MVERYKARADGDIVPAPAEALAAKGRRKVKRTTVTLKAVKELRPATTEIIVCTGLKTRGIRHCNRRDCRYGRAPAPCRVGCR